MTLSSTAACHQSDGDPCNSTDSDVNQSISILHWKTSDVVSWASHNERCSPAVIYCLAEEDIDGEVLMALTEEDIRDFRHKFNYKLTFSELKKLWLSVRTLQFRYRTNSEAVESSLPLLPELSAYHGLNSPHIPSSKHYSTALNGIYPQALPSAFTATGVALTPIAADVLCAVDSENVTAHISIDERTPNIPPEFFKTAISLGYSFLVTWITSFVMVIVHERVPDMKRYPPLPDIFLDNVPHIPWAFHMCEITGTLLFIIWLCVCIIHKYRTVLLRRFFALAGTVFLLRCVTMLITSLSVPGTHLQCHQNDYPIDDTELTISEALKLRIIRAYTIWSGLGMSLQGVRTCGDYMFSGHTVALTLLNFFITEYTPRNLYFLHTLTWLLNMFGIFFILAAHEHYSIDVFVAFYITSRLFLYYHTLANNQALMSRDSNRTRIWFPMFSYFESSVIGIIPNEYEAISTLLNNFGRALLQIAMYVKDSIMLTTRRIWIDPPNMTTNVRSRAGVVTSITIMQKNVATSTNVMTTPMQQGSSVLSAAAINSSTTIDDQTHKIEAIQPNKVTTMADSKKDN